MQILTPLVITFTSLIFIERQSKEDEQFSPEVIVEESKGHDGFGARYSSEDDDDP
jgi:hypothetical protein